MMRRLLIPGLCAAVFACGELPVEERPKVVLAVFDPSKSEVPSPNDLAMVEGKVTIAPNDAAPAADNELKSYLNGRDGFSIGSSTKVRFSGPISAASFSDESIIALDLGRAGEGQAPKAVAVKYEYAACDHSLTLTSPAGFVPGHTYLFAVRGGDGEAAVRGEDGEKVVASPAFHFLKAGEDLRQHPSAFPGTRAQKEASAQALEAVRQKYEPLFLALEENGLPRRDVAILWTFTAQTTGELYFDPSVKQIPMPNDLLRNPETGLVSVPIDPAEPQAAQALKRAFNQLDGFSMTGALTLSASAPVKRESLILGETVRVFRADTLEEKTDFELTLSEDGRSISLLPKTPLLPATRYVVVLVGVRDTQENVLSSMPLATLLKLNSPLLTDGKSNISSLCAETVERIEPLRAAIDPVLDALPISRHDVGAVWTFTTQDVLKRVHQMWATPYVQDLPLEVFNVDNRSPLQRGLPLFQVARVITGRLTTYDYLDPVTRAFRENGAGVHRQIEFVLTLPRGLDEGDKVPVVVFGHGLMTERRLGLMLADKLAGAGYAMMAIDFPLHGERTACLEDSHCASGATCAIDGRCVKDDKPADLARAPVLPGWGVGVPTATGQAFVDVENLAGSRDHFRQALVDVSAQVRLIRQMDWREATGGFHLDGDRLYYAGISLGGILGSNFSATEPAFRSMLLNVGGAGMVGLMEESATFGPVLTSGLNAKGIEKGTPQYEAFKNAARWILDEVDPINLVRYGATSPRTYADPLTGETKVAAKKALRLHMAIGDAVVPNTATRRLLLASGVDEATQFRSFVGSHGFLANPSEAACYVGQDDMVDFFEANP